MTTPCMAFGVYFLSLRILSVFDLSWTGDLSLQSSASLACLTLTLLRCDWRRPPPTPPHNLSIPVLNQWCPVTPSLLMKSNWLYFHGTTGSFPPPYPSSGLFSVLYRSSRSICFRSTTLHLLCIDSPSLAFVFLWFPLPSGTRPASFVLHPCFILLSSSYHPHFAYTFS